MVKAKNNVAKIVAFMLVLALIMSVFAFVMPKHTVAVEAATKEAGLYKDGVKTKTWQQLFDEGILTIIDYIHGRTLEIPTDKADLLDGELVFGEFDEQIYGIIGLNKCSNLKSVNIEALKSLVPGGCSDLLYQLFSDCSSIEEVDVGDFSPTGGNLSVGGMFQNCTNLKTVKGTIDLTYVNAEEEAHDSNYGTGRAVEGMFSGCTSLESIDLSKLLVNSKCTVSLNYMFKDCTSLKSVIVGKDTFYDAFFYIGMFSGCSSLEQIIDITMFSSSVGDMLDGCTSLKRIQFGEVHLVDGNQLDLPTAESNAHFATTDAPSTALTVITSDQSGKTIELFDQNNKSLAPAPVGPVNPAVPSTGVVANAMMVVVPFVLVIALCVAARKKQTN